MKVKSLAAAVCLAFVLSAASFAATPASSRHASAGVKCEQCHGSEITGPAKTEKCTGCHGTYESIAKKTESLIPNPHASHMGNLDCTVCHAEHGQQKVFCNDCHTFKTLKLN
jgi:DnaJ-class molecular chaperone